MLDSPGIRRSRWSASLRFASLFVHSSHFLRGWGVECLRVFVICFGSGVFLRLGRNRLRLNMLRIAVEVVIHPNVLFSRADADVGFGPRVLGLNMCHGDGPGLVCGVAAEVVGLVLKRGKRGDGSCVDGRRGHGREVRNGVDFGSLF